ncbi:MAG: primosomal protein N' [Candidatus Ratteibacteria bacterium]|nr:primosomal protein N' [Candidatus Ratteibacteria bacterium]
MSNKTYAGIVFDLPINKEFHYRIPRELKDRAVIGKRVSVPFGKKTLPGFIVGLTDRPDIPEEKIKEIFQVLDDEPLLNQEIFRLAGWISRYYFCSRGKALFEAVPAAVKKGAPKRERKKAASLSAKAAFPKHIPNRPQAKALNLIKNTLEKGLFEVLLLFGAVGSGKTEVCLQAIDCCLKMEKQVIILVPEVSKIPRIFKRLVKQYGRRAGVLHSGLPRREHYEQWQKIKKGETDIVIGARSAIFAPFNKLGMIIIFDEDDGSYKQSDDPKYHAREAALQRARMNRALVILSSAAPSLETFYQAERKKYKMAVLPERFDKTPPCEVQIVDMTRVRSGYRIISPSLEEAIRERMKNREGIILFLNRRGFATALLCRQCGFVLRCPDCNVSLIFHQDDGLAHCHYCGYRQSPPSVCPQCFSSYIRYTGLGTQKVEEAVNRKFSGARVIRMDTDSVRRENARRDLLRKFEAGDSDFLIGTQMVAKDRGFPRATLVGVISADVTLNLPDFRSGEKNFQLLSRITGQMGKKGRVIIQTYHPDHFSLMAVKNHDYRAFYREELKFRRELTYPPFSHFTNITVRGKDENSVKKNSNRLFLKLKEAGKHKHFEILGPFSSPYSKIKGKYCRQITLKAKDLKKLQDVFTGVLRDFSAGSKINISVDVDPLRMA